MDLSTARALVTGGGTGIGRAVARRLRDAGARIAIAGRRRDVLALDDRGFVTDATVWATNPR